jgi:hypothetical protein
MRGASFVIVLCVGCAAAHEGPPVDANKGGDGGGSGDGGGATGEACPPGQFATNVSATGQVTCMGLDALTQQALAEHCSAYLGWIDNCDGCMSPPAKWGRAGSTSCMPGVGVGNTCTMPNLGGASVHMFGLDLEGDVDGNDKLYGGLACTADSSANGVGPCPAGQLVDGFNGSAWTCSSFAKTAIAFVRANCSLFLGWQDNCDGCTNPPVKWGVTSDAACMNGAGADNTCIAPTALGTETVRLFGINPDGDVDGNDKLHVALRCETPNVATETQTMVCPAGYYVSATMSGSFKCESVMPSIAKYFGDHCTLYFGWHDGCDGCTTPPTKWGKVRFGACANGVGADNTCSTFALAESVEMFGLSPDGDVDGNDMLYVGFTCD